jgi:non-canonical (house-cleaning) NTP pyrophosphatase
MESHDKVGMAKTAMLQLPPRIVELIQQGIELGDADDIVF